MSTRKPLRIKKLSVKTTLAVLREDQIDPNEYESLPTHDRIVTGVEGGEEKEYHLQAALKGAGQSTDNKIPVPPPQESERVNYDGLYPTRFVEPRGYIKFSDTVEETLGCLYDMTTEDDVFLKTYNADKSAKAQLSEDDFERIMFMFEHTASEQAPFASVDNTVVSYEVMAQHMTNTHINNLQNHTKQVYEHWKSRRQACGNNSLHPELRFETHQENDDLDPYVCFRRREVRQTRKTRARDVQVADKLKKMRRELEDARLLVISCHQREAMKKELLKTERMLFEHRAKLKEKKLRLGIKADEEDLYNAKPAKRKISEVPAQARGGPHTQLRVSVRPDGRVVEQDLLLLEDKRKEQHEEFRRDILHKVQNHKHWNQNYTDLTERPLSPVNEDIDLSFRPAKAQFLPTPPASASESMELDTEPASFDAALGVLSTASNGFIAIYDAALKARPISFGTPTGFRTWGSEESEVMPSYRRRVGRNGRQFIDRRFGHPARLASPPSDSEPLRNDRFKYDQDDSEDDQPCYTVDPYDEEALSYRSRLPPNTLVRHAGHRPIPIADANAAAQAGSVNRPALPPAPTVRPLQPPSQAQPLVARAQQAVT